MAKANENGDRRTLSAQETAALLKTLKTRFDAHRERHEKLDWAEVEARLVLRPEKLWALSEMERTGGEPDLVGRDEATGGYLFFDCSAESPAGRRSLCYDREALESRKESKPAQSAAGMAEAMGVELLTEGQYRALQKLGEFDMKTSSWVKTPEPIRTLGGALFCDRRYGAVFTYHNGTGSYYAARGFRGSLSV